jgi:hypothetical protein
MQKVSAVPSVRNEKSVWMSSALVALCFCVAMLFGRPAAAQTGQQFVGHVEDSSHASIAKATVTIHNEGTAEDIVVKTTGAGDYTAPYLKSGNYTIEASMQGFKAVSKTHIHLDTDQSSKIDFTLPIGDVTETVTVNSAGSQIDLSKADRGEIIGSERVEEMPMDGRNPLELFELSPGTINNHNPQFTRPQDNVNGDLYVNGNAVTSAPVQENIDGSTNDNTGGFVGYVPSPDSIAEFKVVLNPYDASYGRAGGGAVDITLKSGSNKYHGDIYEYARRPYLDAQSYSYDYNSSLPNQCPAFPAIQPKGCISAQIPNRHKRDQFGLETDGPLTIPHVYNGKDKTFFTFQWEQAYENLPSTSGTTSSIPNPAWLAGDFHTDTYIYTPQAYTPGSGNNQQNVCAGQTLCLLPLGIYDPTSPVTSVTDPNDGKSKRAHSQFPGNNCGDMSGAPIICMVPTTSSDPVVAASRATGQLIAKFYNQITPNFNSGPGYAPYTNNFFFLPVEYDISRNFLVKIDQNFGPRDRGSVRFEYLERFDQNFNEGIPASNLGNQESFQVQPKDNNYAIDEIHTFSPNLILDNKLTLLNGKQGSFSGSRDPNILTELGMSQHYITNAFYTNIFPSISTGGAINLGGGPKGYSISHVLGYQPSFTYIRGRHTIRGGLDMRLEQFANPGGGSSNQSLTFSSTFSQHYTPALGDASGFTSGTGIAALVLGDPSGAGIKYSIDVDYSQHYYAPWLQDDWKVTPKMTLNFGLRYDLLTARTERHNKLNYAFDTTDVSPVDASLSSHAGFSGPILGGITFAGVNGKPRGAYATNLLNLQPRFGIAYAFSSKTSLRAGFGEEFINDEGNDSSNGFSSSATGYNSNVADSVSGVVTDNNYPYGHANDPFPSYVLPTGSSLGLATTLGSSVNFKDPNYQIPNEWEYSVSLEQLLSRRDTLEIAYSGTRAYNLLDSLQLNNVSAAWNARCDIERGGNRQLCDSSKQGPSQAPNPFYQNPLFAGSGSYSTSPLISTGTFTKAFPQFTGISQDNSPFVHSWYNSMQVSAAHNVSKSLSLHAAFSWSKAEKAGQVVDSVNGVFGRSLSASDTPIVITFSSVFYLPVGRGKEFLGHTNRIVDGVVGGWEISPLYVYTGGKPFSLGSNWEYISPIGIRAHDLPVDGNHIYKRVQGVTPCVAYKDTDLGTLTYGPAYKAAGCTSPAAVRTPNGYAINHNIIFWGVRTSATHEFDASLSKRFAWNERANLQLRLDAFNILNHGNFTNGYSTDPTSIDFGTFGKNNSPANPVRDLQISGKVTF